jgi:hypothetical protein
MSKHKAPKHPEEAAPTAEKLRKQRSGPLFTGTVTTNKRPGDEHEEALRKAAEELRKRAKG